MEYELLAIDLDDTLLGDDYKIAARTQEAIKQAEELGVKVVIATGRMYASALPYIKQLECTEEVITYNGALVKEAATDEIIDHQPVPLELAQQVSTYVEEHDLHLNLYVDDLLYVNKVGLEAEYYEEVSGVKPILIEEEVTDFLDQPSTKLLIVEKDLDRVEEILADLEEQLGSQLYITASKSYFIEIMTPDVSKAAALDRVAEKAGIAAEDIVAIGDSYNDLEMIDYAGLGVAVDNARGQVKEVADYITLSNDEAGVAEVIEKFILD
ncbi:Cof-type HAD-IIB family hydrolase [Halanaerobaculum tunisiense]